jgi:hypothetical protein
MSAHLLKNATKLLCTILGIILLFNAAQSANFNSGKTKKKASNKSSTLHFTLHNKSSYLSSSNGFSFKGGAYVFKNHKSGIDVQLKTAYFSKGNNIYVQPLKNKVILSRFKAPQKSIY